MLLDLSKNFLLFLIYKGVASERGSETYAYDERGRVTSVQREGHGPDLAYAYDAVGNLVTRTVGDRDTTYAYDADNRLVEVGGDGLSAAMAEELPLIARIGSLLAISSASRGAGSSSGTAG